MTRKFWNIICIFKGCLVLLWSSHGQAYVVETELRSNLSQGYNRFVRPATPTVLHINFNIRALQKIDIAEQQMTLTSWISISWFDARLQWNKTQHGLEALEVNWAWRPEITLGNMAATSPTHVWGIDNDDTRLRVYSTGHVSWNPVLQLVTSCDVDISNFPFDTQTCNIVVMLWGASKDELTINSTDDKILTFSYMLNAEWELLDTWVDNSAAAELCCPRRNAPIIQFFLKYRRRRPFYIMNLVVPTIMMSLCMILAFMVPTDSGERLGFALTILLAYTVQLSIIAQMMPTTSIQVPHIAQYLLIVLVLCSLVTLNVVINVKLYHNEGPVYGWLQKLYKIIYPIVYFRCRCFKGKDNSCEVEELQCDAFKKQSEQEMTSCDKQNANENDEEVTWQNVSVLLDRLCLYSYIIAVAACTGDFLSSINE